MSRSAGPETAALAAPLLLSNGGLPAWVVPLRAIGVRPPLFCTCVGGGDTLAYRDLALALPEDQPVYSFGLPAIEDGTSFPSVEQLAAAYVPAVLAVQPHGSYHLCGHSFGGLIAYELAARLAGMGKDVRLVAMLDTVNPGFKEIMPLGEWIAFQLAYLASRFAKYGNSLWRGRIDIALADSLVYLAGKAKRTYWRAAHLLFGRLGHALPRAVASNALVLSAAWRAYRPKDHDVPVALFNAAERPPEFRADPTLGWTACLGRPAKLHMVPGDHLSMLRPPHVRSLAECMTPYLGMSAQPDQVSEIATACR